MTDIAPEVIADMQAAVNSPTGKVQIGPVFGMRGTYYAAQVYDGRKKVGPLLVNSQEHPATPAGALRSLADVMEMAVDRD